MKQSATKPLFVDASEATATTEQWGATFSPCSAYRYTLWREWGGTKHTGYLNVIACNPSTANEVENDPTISRLMTRAKSMEFGGLYVTNIFAYRATDPKVMLAQANPVGPDNDAAIVEVARGASMVICAWGEQGKHMGRGTAVRSLLRNAGVPCFHLTLNKSGEPKHPLYIGYNEWPKSYNF